MRGSSALAQSAEWGIVVAVPLLGLAVAALVALTPWHLSDLPGGHQPPGHQPAVEVRAPQGRHALIPVVDAHSTVRNRR
jgi:hypothetical protein